MRIAVYACAGGQNERLFVSNAAPYTTARWAGIGVRSLQALADIDSAFEHDARSDDEPHGQRGVSARAEERVLG